VSMLYKLFTYLYPMLLQKSLCSY